MESYELLPSVHINLGGEAGNNGHDQQQEETHNVGATVTNTPMVIRKKLETFKKVDAAEAKAFVAAAVSCDEAEKEKVKEICVTETTDSDARLRSNSFHFAAKHGFTEVVMRMMNMGYTKLLWPDDLDDPDRVIQDKLPVEVAVDEEHYDTAEALLKRMDKWKAIQLFKLRPGEQKPRISLFKLLNHLVDQQEKNPQKMEQKDTQEDDLQMQEALDLQLQQLQQFLLAVLDTTVGEQEVDLELLEADENGKVPRDKHGKFEETFGKGHISCFSIIISNNLEELEKHESFRKLVQKKWINYGQVASCQSFLWYLVFMIFLTTSLVLAARSSDPNDYSQPIDGFRLFCEIITVFLVYFETIFELKDFYHTYNNNKRHNLWDAIKAHLQSAPNVLDFSALLTFWLIIPCRIADADAQWVFASIAYILFGLRIFKHAVMFWSVAVYIRIILRIISRDLIQFIMVLIVILLSFGGGLYFALRGRTHTPDSGSGSGSNEFDPVDDTDLGLFPDDTREIYLAWLTGFRILTEGSVLDYYGKDGPGEYGVLGAFIYWLFVFTVTIILLSLLIAQFSVSFEEQKETAEEGVTLTRTELLQQIHIFFPTRLLKVHLIISRWLGKIFGSEPVELKIKRSLSKAQKAHAQLIARQETLEGEAYRMQHTVLEIGKTLKDVQTDVKIILQTMRRKDSKESGADNK